jgi:predicted ArsR family transcriptional regulator
LGLLRTAGGPVDVQHVADTLQIHITTARFHLSTLEDQGVVRRAGPRGRGVGRPRLTYEVAPRFDYADIVALFATHLGGTPEERQVRALRIGADLANRIHLTSRRGESSIADLVVGTLHQLGFEIRSVLDAFGEVTVRICTCPLAAIAVDAPEVVQGIQQGLIQEVIDQSAPALGHRYSAAVWPDSRQGSCEVSLVLRPAQLSGSTARANRQATPGRVVVGQKRRQSRGEDTGFIGGSINSADRP